MKNIKKIFAVILSLTAALSAGATRVSAEPAAAIGIYKVEGGKNGDFPLLKKVTEEYKGILIKMPDGTVPPTETPGLENCKLYSEVREELINIQYGNIVTLAEGDDSAYFISDKDIPEEKAEEFVKKLRINGIVSSADILYYTYTTNSYMDIHQSDSKATVGVIICYNNSYTDSVYHKPAEADKKLCGFKEFSDAGFTAYELFVSEEYIHYSLEYDPQVYESGWKLYEELLRVCSIIKADYSSDKNFTDADISWATPVSTNTSAKLYSPEILWGDATNDNIIDLYDAIEIAKYMIGKSDIDEFYIKLADINRDGKTDLYDAIRIAETLT